MHQLHSICCLTRPLACSCSRIRSIGEWWLALQVSPSAQSPSSACQSADEASSQRGFVPLSHVLMCQKKEGPLGCRIRRLQAKLEQRIRRLPISPDTAFLCLDSVVPAIAMQWTDGREIGAWARLAPVPHLSTLNLLPIDTVLDLHNTFTSATTRPAILPKSPAATAGVVSTAHCTVRLDIRAYDPLLAESEPVAFVCGKQTHRMTFVQP